MGGMLDNTIYPKLIDQEKVFYDLAFDFTTHDLHREYNIYFQPTWSFSAGWRG